MAANVLGSFPASTVVLLFLIACFDTTGTSYSSAFALAPSSTTTENLNIRHSRRKHSIISYSPSLSLQSTTTPNCRRHQSFRNPGYETEGLPLLTLSATGKLGAERTPASLRRQDYLITDSLDLDDRDRPTVKEFLFSVYPREGFLRLPLLLCGTAISVSNVLGNYEGSLYAPLVLSCVILGMSNAVLDAIEQVSEPPRRGSIDAKVLQIYAGTYGLSVCWMALRVYPPVCPDWLPAFDPIMGTATSIIFVASLAVPLITLLGDLFPENAGLEKFQLGLVRLVRGDNEISELPPFTSIERYRAFGLLVIGFVACLYLPIASYLAVFGDDWWSTSLERFPQQGLLEASTAIFGLLAAQSNVSITRASGCGVRPMTECVNLGSLACLGLAVVPCVASLYYLQAGTTFFEHYQYIPK